jgi:O-antigen ligase
MTRLIALIVALSTLAFGAVYPWGFVPLFGAAAAIGVTGLYKAGLRPQLRPLALALFAVCAAATVQLVPMPPAVLARVSPATPALLATYDLIFANAPGWAPLSIRPPSTAVAVVALIALSLYLLGLTGLLWSSTLRSLPGALAIFVVPLALYGMYTREHNNGLIYGFWQAQDGGGGNQFGPFINRNHFGGWMLMTLGLLIGSVLGRFEGTLRGNAAGRSRLLAWLSSPSANSFLLKGGVVILGIVSIFWSLSRSSIVGLAAMVTAFAWLASQRRRLGTTRRSVAVVSLGAALVAGVAWRGPARVVSWFQDDRNLLGRFDAWRDAWDVIQAFPMSGTGMNTFGDAMLVYQKRNAGFHMAQAHNDYLQLAAEGGLLVVVPALVAAVLLAHAIRQNLRAARPESRGYWIRAGAAIGLVAVAVQEVVEFSLQIPVNAFLFATLAAAALAPVASHPPPPPEPRDTIHPGLPRTTPGGSLS